MDAAASMIEKAIVANPTYAEAYNNLGLFLPLRLASSERLLLMSLLTCCINTVLFLFSPLFDMYHVYQLF